MVVVLGASLRVAKTGHYRVDMQAVASMVGMVRKSWGRRRGGGNTGVLSTSDEPVDKVPFQTCVSARLENGYGLVVV